MLSSSKHVDHHDTMEHAMEEYEENVTALKKLFQGKSQPAQMVQNLLDATRKLRAEWIKKSTDISIQDIIRKFPALNHPKWVCYSLYITAPLFDCAHCVCTYIYMQVLFEFNKQMDDTPIKDVISANWKKVCLKILDESESTSYSDEKKVLATITRNIYHKKPPLDAIRFYEVGITIMLT